MFYGKMSKNARDERAGGNGHGTRNGIFFKIFFRSGLTFTSRLVSMWGTDGLKVCLAVRGTLIEQLRPRVGQTTHEKQPAEICEINFRKLIAKKKTSITIKTNVKELRALRAITGAVRSQGGRDLF